MEDFELNEKENKGYLEFKKDMLSKLNVLVPIDRQKDFSLVTYDSGRGFFVDDGKARGENGIILPRYDFHDMYEEYKESGRSIEKFQSYYVKKICNAYDNTIARENYILDKLERIKAECPADTLILSCSSNSKVLLDKAVCFHQGNFGVYLSALLTPLDMMKNADSFTVYDIPQADVSNWKDKDGKVLDYKGFDSKLFDIALRNTEKYFPPIAEKKLGLNKTPFYRVSSPREGILTAFYNGNLKSISNDCKDSLTIYPVSMNFFYILPYQKSLDIGLSKVFDNFSYVFSPTGINDKGIDTNIEKWFYSKDADSIAFSKNEFDHMNELVKSQSRSI